MNKYKLAVTEFGFNNGKYHNRINWEYVARCLLKHLSEQYEGNTKEANKWYYAAFYEMEHQADMDNAEAALDDSILKEHN